MNAGIADKLDEGITVSKAGKRAGRDAFHRVPFFSNEVTDAVERVPTMTGGQREPAVNSSARVLSWQ